MKNSSWCSLQDALAKMDAQTKLVKGGSQYTPGVSMEVAGINRGKGMMRLGKRKPAEQIKLAELIKRV